MMVAVFVLPPSLAEYNIDDSLLYKIDFPGVVKPVVVDSSKDTNTEDVKPTGEVQEDRKLLFDKQEEPLETVLMTTSSHEKYYCTIPRVQDKRGEEEAAYTGLNPLQLMEKLFTQQACAYRLESYWTYELCHGKALRQYHEEREDKSIKVQEYFLGRFDKEKYDELVAAHDKDVSEGITRHPPTKKIETMNMPYYEISMEDGTLCDLNNLPRRARVLYVCYPAGKNEIYSLKEVSTCEYEVIVLTALLCSHPSYRPVESNEHVIGCRPAEETVARKPKKLQELETESIKLRSEKMFEAHMSGGNKPGQVKIEIKEVKIDNVDEEELENAREKEKEEHWTGGDKRQPFKPLMDPQVVKDFLKGDYCLYGGSGWWKYEFCYGKKVDQYHDEPTGQKTVINLGRFDLSNHQAWLYKFPTKKPKRSQDRKHVSHFYSGGDICDLTGRERQIEVKLKCKKADSPSTVSLYLLEPKTCEYVLGVESPLVCDILPHVDEDGMMTAGIIDSVDKDGNVGTAAEGKEEEPEEKEIEKLDQDGLFTPEEQKRFDELKDRLKTGEGKVTTISKHSKIIKGVRQTVQKTVVDGEVVSEVVLKEDVSKEDWVKLKANRLGLNVNGRGGVSKEEERKGADSVDYSDDNDAGEDIFDDDYTDDDDEEEEEELK